MDPEAAVGLHRALSAESAHSRDTFAYFGLAMFRAQCVEKQLAILLASTLNPDFLRATPEERDRYFDAEFDRTLGQLVRSLRATLPMPQALEGRLARALILRNWLAHEYFWQRAPSALTRNGRDQMIVELQEAADYLRSVDQELTDVTDSWLAQHGVSRETIEAELDLLLRERGRG
jgi:hypothetical protein